MRVEIYSKPDCPLCEEAQELISEARSEFGFELLVHNILTDEGWFAAHRHFVPVVYVDGVRALELRFTAEQLSSALKAASR